MMNWTSRQTFFERTIRHPSVPWDDNELDEEASTYQWVETHRGPDPVPAWVITEDRARQCQRGLSKTGKEADVYLVERSLDDRTKPSRSEGVSEVRGSDVRNEARCRPNRRGVLTRPRFASRTRVSD
jgi:hypothetical protein